MIDSMTVNPSGGTQLFPHRPTAASQLPKNAANHTAAPSTHSKHSANTAPAAVTNGEHTTAVLYDTIQVWKQIIYNYVVVKNALFQLVLIYFLHHALNLLII